MTRLLLVLLVAVAAICARSFPEPQDEPHDPLQIDPNAHPKDTLSNYLNSLTNYIYKTDSLAGADPRAAFFNQEHQLRIYETLNHYVEENYGLTLREILNPAYYDIDSSLEQLKDQFIAAMTAFADRVAEMFLTVIYTSGDKLADEQRLQQVQQKRREVINTFVKYASGKEVIDVYFRMASIHEHVLKNFNATAYGKEEAKIRGKREALINEKELQEEVNGYLNKLTAFVYGASAAEFLSQKFGKKQDLNIQPLGSLIAFKRFIEANYKQVLDLDLPAFADRTEKLQEITEIFNIEARTTELWFEVVNYANLDLLKNQTIIDDINVEIADRLYAYAHFRTFDEIKETNRRIHEVYGHLLQDCDTSSYRALSKIFQKADFLELFGRASDSSPAPSDTNIEKVLIYAEAVWQPKHGLSKDEKKRVRNLLNVVNEDGINLLISVFEGHVGVDGWGVGSELRHIFDDFQNRFNETNGFKSNFNETEGVRLFNETGIELALFNETSKLLQHPQ